MKPIFIIDKDINSIIGKLETDYNEVVKTKKGAWKVIKKPTYDLGKKDCYSLALDFLNRLGVTDIDGNELKDTGGTDLPKKFDELKKICK